MSYNVRYVDTQSDPSYAIDDFTAGLLQRVRSFLCALFYFEM